jgi:hypothetical protein
MEPELSLGVTQSLVVALNSNGVECRILFKCFVFTNVHDELIDAWYYEFSKKNNLPVLNFKLWHLNLLIQVVGVNVHVESVKFIFIVRDSVCVD